VYEKKKKNKSSYYYYCIVSHFPSPIERNRNIRLTPAKKKYDTFITPKKVITQASSAQDAVRNILTAGENIQFRNVHASSHACFKTFTNGHAMGTTATAAAAAVVGSNNDGGGGGGTVETNNHNIDDPYLLPERGLIMSTGDPDQFCINDSDVQTTQWGTPGDADLTSIASGTNQAALTYDAVSLRPIPFCLVP
jgi:hypothetical protein